MKESIAMDQPVKKGSTATKIVLPILIVLIVALGALTYYFYTQVENLKKNPQQLAEQEVANLVEQVGKLVVLPEGETPTIATVTDPEKLRDQPFFANAKVGDRVLIYTNARKAILYDPVKNKILEIAPVNIGEQQ